MCIYVYICIEMYGNVCMYTYIHACIHTYIHAYIRIHKDNALYIDDVDLSVVDPEARGETMTCPRCEKQAQYKMIRFIIIHVCTYMCMCVYMCVYMYIYTYTHTYTYMCMYVYIYIYIERERCTT